jgi:lycopene cyclase domain-containing protein
MTYAVFLLIFIVPFIIFGFSKLFKDYPDRVEDVFKGIGFLCFMAMTYTTPWDNYLVANEIWWYGPDRVLGVIGYVPIEEYSFFLLQTVMSGLFFFFVLQKFPTTVTIRYQLPRFAASFFFLITTIAGIMMFFNESTRYMGLIVGWASPVMILQWFIGGDIFWQNKKAYLIGILLPTFYLWGADAYAIYDQIWTISPKFTTGIKMGVLPIEEAIFFLMTNMMVVQGLQLFWYFSELNREGKISFKELFSASIMEIKDAK